MYGVCGLFVVGNIESLFSVEVVSFDGIDPQQQSKEKIDPIGFIKHLNVSAIEVMKKTPEAA